MARSNNDLTLQVGFDIDRFNKELAKTNQSLTKWSGGVMSSLKGLAAGFSAIAIGRFTLDVSKLAGEAEGVSAAFVKLENSAKLMNDLKVATGGTVAELELMKRAVMASNFDISLKALPQLLEFATLRARQTGQSVDYLVDSIVTGIGRKSKLILDNLGISAVQLTEALGGASAASSTIGEVADAVGKIASENLVKMGKLTDDASVKAARLSANWENFKVSLGQLANNSGLASLIEGLGELVNLTNVAFGGKANNPLELLETGLKVINQMDLDDSRFKQFFDAVQKLAKQAGVEIRKDFDEGMGKFVFEIDKRGSQQIKAEAKDVLHSVKFLEEQISSLNEEIKLSGSESQINKYQKEIILLQRELDRLLGKQREVAEFILTPSALPEVSTNKADYGNVFGSGNPFDGVDFQIFKSELDEIDSEIEESMKWFDKWNESFQQNTRSMAQGAAMVGDAIGQGIGNIITETENFAQVIGQMARQVVASLERVALAYMIANSAKFGLAGIAAAAVGFGVVKSLFNSIGGDGSSSGMSNRESRRWNDANTPISQMGSKVIFEINGKNLRGVLDLNKVSDSRTRG